jgi:hypothetical protein
MISNIPMVITDETKWIAFGTCKVLSCFGFNNSPADVYLQFHAKPAGLIVAGDVPAVKSLYFPNGTSANYGTNAFGNDGVELTELSSAVSSSEINYTALVNAGLDVTIVVESDFLVKAATTLVGDLTTGVSSLQVWTDANGPKKLRRLTVVNGAGADLTIIVSSRDTPSTTDDVVVRLALPSLATKTYQFGINGHSPYSKDANGSTIYDGCNIKLATAPTLPFIFYGTPSANIYAIYE